MSFGNEGGYSRPGVSVSRYENEEIGWETAYKADLGLELNFLENLTSSLIISTNIVPIF